MAMLLIILATVDAQMGTWGCGRGVCHEGVGIASLTYQLLMYYLVRDGQVPAHPISASVEDFVVSFCLCDEEKKDPFPRDVAEAD
jgi:hypothetical protein